MPRPRARSILDWVSRAGYTKEHYYDCVTRELNSVVCATRFKHYEGNRLMRTRCQKNGCGEADSFEHLLECSGMGTPPAVQPGKEAMEEGNEAMLVYLENLAIRAHEINPGPPVPLWSREGDAEIELFSVGSINTESTENRDTDFEMEFENDLPP